MSDLSTNAWVDVDSLRPGQDIHICFGWFPHPWVQCPEGIRTSTTTTRRVSWGVAPRSVFLEVYPQHNFRLRPAVVGLFPDDEFVTVYTGAEVWYIPKGTPNIAMVIPPRNIMDCGVGILILVYLLSLCGLMLITFAVMEGTWLPGQTRLLRAISRQADGFEESVDARNSTQGTQLIRS